MKLLTRLLGKPEEINGANRCDTYLYRWFIAKTRWGKIYLHKFVGNDWSRDLHDHPKRFISIGLWGSYVEETPREPGFHYPKKRVFRAPWIRSFPPEHIHRLSLIDKKPCWTLVIVTTGTREWGFWHDGEFIHWQRYVYGDKAHVADSQKDCA